MTSVIEFANSLYQREIGKAYFESQKFENSLTWKHLPDTKSVLLTHWIGNLVLISEIILLILYCIDYIPLYWTSQYSLYIDMYTFICIFMTNRLQTGSLTIFSNSIVRWRRILRWFRITKLKFQDVTKLSCKIDFNIQKLCCHYSFHPYTSRMLLIKIFCASASYVTGIISVSDHRAIQGDWSRNTYQ